VGFLLVVRVGGEEKLVFVNLCCFNCHVLGGGKGLESENKVMYALDGLGYK
jgi:hypothetical protein